MFKKGDLGGEKEKRKRGDRGASSEELEAGRRRVTLTEMTSARESVRRGTPLSRYLEMKSIRSNYM
jgi:hypothetical protein